MQWIYGILAVIVIAVVSLVASPVIGLILLVAAIVVGALLFGVMSRNASTLRTQAPEPTGRPRASSGGGQTANQRQGQE
jgi:uncharacterized membrane protein YdcZ (DUF606 family)